MNDQNLNKEKYSNKDTVDFLDFILHLFDQDNDLNGVDADISDTPTYRAKRYGEWQDTESVNNDNVNHPSHYGGKYEVIDILKDKLTEEQFYGFLCGNVIKYMTRWQNKNGLEDLKKAEWYLSYLIKEKEHGEGIKEKTE